MDSSQPAAAPRHFRALARRSVSLSATVVAGGGSWERSALLVDLSLGGACATLSEAIPAGSPVALVIDAPHLWDPLEINGIVAWVDPSSDPARIGVRFQHCSGPGLRALTELLEASLFA